jgi:nitrogen fixation NifU-like protein
MTSAWEQFQEIVKEKMREHFSEIVVEHALNPRNVGDIEDYSGLANYTGPCGDSMQIWLKVEDEKITDASFMTDGCGTTIASGSMITELAKGKSLTDARNLDQKTVLKELGGLPEESEHCALLAERTLKQAIDDYFKRKNEAQ